MVNIHVQRVLDDIDRQLECISRLSTIDDNYKDKVSYLGYLIKSLEEMDDSIAYYNLIVLANDFINIEYLNYDINKSYDYALKYLDLIDEPSPDRFDSLAYNQKSMLSLVYMTIASFIDNNKKNFNDVSADDLYATSYILLPTSEVLKRIVYRYFMGRSSVSVDLLKSLLVDSKKIGFHEAHIYDILISHIDESLDTNDAFNQFYNHVNSSENLTDFIKYIENFMSLNLKSLELSYNDKEDLYKALIPIYCFMFVLGSRLVVSNLDNMLVQYPKYSYILKEILSQDDLIKYVELAKQFRTEQKKEPN